MIRPADILFYGGGECFEKFGVLTMGLTESQRVAAALVRSGAVGPVIGRDEYGDGVLRQASTNRARISWDDDDEDGVFETPALLLEAPEFINLVSSDDITAWTDDGTPVVTSSISDPAGGTGAYRIADDNGAALEAKYRTVTFTGDGVKVVVFAVREATMATSGTQDLVLYDATAAATCLRLAISAWVSGEPTVSAGTGTLLGSWYVGNGYWAIAGLTTSVTAANTNQAHVQPASTAAATGSIDVYRVNAYNATSAPRSILNASATKAVESLTFPWVHKPRQAMSGHTRCRELEAPTWTTETAVDRRVVAIGASAGTAPLLALFRPAGGDSYTFRHDNGVTGVEATVDISPSWGDLIDLFWWFYADGSVNIAARKKSPGGSWGAITTGTPSAALAPAADWSDDVIHFGSVGSTGRGSQAYHRWLIARDTGHSTDDLLAVFG